MFTAGSINGGSTLSVVVTGTGDATKDDVNLAAAASKLNGWNRGTLYIDGTVIVSNNIDFTGPINLIGMDTDAEIRVNNTSDYFTCFSWNLNFSLLSQTSYPVSIPKDKSTHFNPSGGYSPTEGEWVCMWSEDTITDVEPHGSYNPQPLELHQVAHYQSSTNRAYVSDFIVDKMITSGKLAIMPMSNNITIKNLTFSHTGNQGTFANTMRLIACNNVLMDNIRTTRQGAGAIWFDLCSNVKVQNLLIEGTERWESVYGVVVGSVNNFLLSDSVIMGTRHGFTTTASLTKTSPLRRYGTPLNTVLDNVIGHSYTKVSSTNALAARVIFDTHAEGYGVQFNNCTAICGAADAISSIGFQSRSRAAQFNNCKVFGSYGLGESSAGAYAIRFYGSGCVAKDCYVEGTWRGVHIADSQSTYTSNNGVVDNCTFKNITGEAVRQVRGSGVQVRNCVFDNCGISASQNQALIFLSGSGHKVINSYIPRRSNDMAIDNNALLPSSIEVLNNVFTGYNTTASSGPMGFAKNAQGDEFEEKYRSKNITDFGAGSRKQGQDGFGLQSGAINIDFDSENFDNKTLVLQGNLTPTMSATRPGDYKLLVSQDGTGGYTITWGSNVVWETSELQPSGAANSKTLFRFYYDAADFHGESR